MNLLLASKALERDRSMVGGCALQRKMTEYWVPQLTALTPGGGCYLNEVGDLIHCEEPTEEFLFPELISCHIKNRPISISQIGSRRFMAPTMTSFTLSRPNMIRRTSFMPPPRLVASIGRLRRTDGFARLDPAVMLGGLRVYPSYVPFLRPCYEDTQEKWMNEGMRVER